MDEDIVSIVFGYEELLLLLQLLQIAPLPGMDQNPAEGASPDTIDGAMVAAERGLRARGFIHAVEGEDEIIVYAPIMSLLGSCVTAHTLLLVTVEPGDGPADARYYHISEHMAVERSFPDVGLHQFTGGVQFEQIAHRLLEMLRISDQSRPADGRGTVVGSALEEARDKAPSDKDEALRALEQGGLPPDIAQGLARTLSDLVCVGTVGAEYADPEAASRGVEIVVGQQGIWGLLATDEDDQFEVLSLSGDDAAERIMAMATAGVPTE